jgi:ADP-heptose:LPS heptosyltransferase
MTILLVRLRLIGDVVFTTPAIRAIRRAMPDSRLVYLVESAAAPVVQDNPHLDRVLVAPRVQGWRRPVADAALAARLYRMRFDAAIDFHGGPRASWLTYATRAPLRIGYDITARNWMYTVVVPRPRELRPRHSVENQWDLLAPLHPALARRVDPAADRVEMKESPEAAARVARRLEEAGISSRNRLIVIHVSAGNPFRRWPAEFFADLTARLGAGDPVRRIILTSGPSDLEAARAIGARARALLDHRRDAILAGEEVSLAELRSLVARASLFIGGDSGPLHVAATSEVPIVGLYGPTLPARSAPWRSPSLITESVELGDLPCRPCDQRHCVPGDFRCLTQLSADLVFQAAERALARGR